MWPLRFAVIEITNRCNLRCPHCASTSGAPREDELSFDEIDRLLQDVRRLGGEEITIIGGEALLRADWFEICERVVDLGMRLVLISNGIPIRSEEILEKIKSLRPHVLGISLDGATRDSYRRFRGVDRYDHVLALLHRLHSDGHPQVNAITTITRGNLREFDKFVELFEDTGIAWQVQLANKGGERFDPGLFLTIDDYKWFVERMTRTYRDHPGLRLVHMDDFGYCPIDPTLRFLHQTWKGCIAGRELIGVRSDGHILGCLSLGDELVEANIRETPLDEIWSSERFFERFRHKTRYLSGRCRTCAFAETCRAGCTGVAFSATGGIGENPYCIRAIEEESILDGVFEGDSVTCSRIGNSSGETTP